MTARPPGILPVPPPSVPAASSRRTIFVLHPSMILTDHRPSGDGLLAFEVLTGLARRGHQVHVAVSLQSINGAIPPGLHLYDIKTFTTPSPFGAGLLNRVEFGLRAGRLFRSLNRTIAFDIVHQLNPVVYGLCFFARIRKTPLIMGPIPPAWPRGAEHANTLRRRLIDRIKGPMLRLQFRAAAHLLPTSNFGLEQLLLKNMGRTRATVLPYGIDPERFSPGEPALGPETPTILFLANLWRRKGIFVLLQAFALVHQAMPTARLIIAGEGTDADEVRAQVAAHPAARRIEMIGMVPRERVPHVLRQCSVFCLPSFGEPFGMTALEAMSCGRPVVATKAGGLAHLASETGTLLVPTADPEFLAAALFRVLSDPQLALAMGRENRRHVLAHYSWHAVLDRLEAIYTQHIPVSDRPEQPQPKPSQPKPSACYSARS